MLLSFLLWGGAGTAILGLFSRSKRAILGGLAAAIVALLWPARLTRSTTRASRLDDFMPAWQFSERHERHIAAPPERVFQAIHAVTAKDITLFRTLVAIRRFGRRGAESILQPKESDPILDVATRTTFRYLADEPPREIVIGTMVGPRTPAAMNFLVTPDGRGGSNVSTETRVFAETPEALRRFKIYWRIIHPGSDIIRRMWLRAVERRS